MFEGLTSRLQEAFRKLRGKGKLTEADIDSALHDVRLALLEADVNYKVVKKFIDDVRARCVGQEVMRSLTPAQQVIKIVNEEMIALMGSSSSELAVSAEPPTIIMLVGLQGSGKTTVAGKIARRFVKQGKKPLMVAADVYRPAAITQLEVLGKSINVPVFSMGTDSSPVDICLGSINHAKSMGLDPVIIDTAGRLHIDEQLMGELREIKRGIRPTEVLLVADSMTGQDAVNVAKEFDSNLEISGVVLTKLDGDARGGAALSIKAVTGKPIKFVGVGEKLDALEEFHPDRMASRILGMGDVLTLIEKAEAALDEEHAKDLEKRLSEHRGLTFDDFLYQLQQLKNMGSLDQLISMLPGLGSLGGIQIDEARLKKTEAIIRSMTKQERQNPRILNGSRRLRIAKGSGTTVQDVNSVIRQFEQVNKMVKQLADMDKKSKRRLKHGFPFLFGR